MEPTESQRNPLRVPSSSLSFRVLFMVWLVDTILLAWVFTDMVLHGSTAESSKWLTDLCTVWGGTAALLIGPFWKTIKQWPAPYRKLLLLGVLTIVAVGGILFWIRARQTAKLETLFKEDKEVERDAGPKKQRFVQLLRKKENVKNLTEYLQWCAELETAINDYEAVERQVDNLLSQMQQEIGELKPQASYGSLLPGFAVLRGVFAKDLEGAEAYRREIEYAKQLTDIPVADRNQFYNVNIQPVIELELKSGRDEIEILKDAKRRGITLPESVYQGAGIK